MRTLTVTCMFANVYATQSGAETTLVHLHGLGMLKANVLKPPRSSEAVAEAKLSEDISSGSVLEALNVPFAMPPVGSRRFMRARDPQPWTGQRDATAFGPGCLQQATSYDNKTFPTSEDCLQLNVWSRRSHYAQDGPAPGVSATDGVAPRRTLRPVLVWAFGGGLTSGSGVAFNGTHLAWLGDVVVVTLNYRLGAFGFYASEEIERESGATGGMNGVHDILQANACTHARMHACTHARMHACTLTLHTRCCLPSPLRRCWKAAELDRAKVKLPRPHPSSHALLSLLPACPPPRHCALSASTSPPSAGIRTK